MQTIRMSGTTDPDGKLNLSLAVGQPNAKFDAVVLLQPKNAADDGQTNAESVDAKSEDSDEGRSYTDILSELERIFAAVHRQYRRALEANDLEAVAIAKDDVARWMLRMITIHLEARIGMSSSNWVWLDGEEECEVQWVGLELRVAGRIWCSLPEGRREWTEPFAASMVHAPDTLRLASYTLWWGNRTTLLDLATVERLVRSGEKPSLLTQIERSLRGVQALSPPAPINDDGWAYVFRMGEVGEVDDPMGAAQFVVLAGD